MEQKFKRGNLVKVLVGHQIWSSEKGETKTIDISPDDVGRTALIEYSYNDKYGGGNVNDYSIMWTDTGSTVAWKSTNELQLIEEGGEHLFAECLAKREAISKANTDIKQIVENWVAKEGKLSSETILFLFDKIGYKSSFLRNGEFYVLFADWADLYPLFDVVMTAKIEQDVTGILKEECPADFRNKIVEFFNEVQSIKSLCGGKNNY
jgi:hypothetical protein